MVNRAAEAHLGMTRDKVLGKTVYELYPKESADIIAGQDPFRPPATWNEAREAFGARVTVCRIPDASHALIPEQPQAVVDAIVGWARQL